MLDPAIIEARQPQNVVKDVMAKTGFNRVTAQRMTAAMRTDMRRKRTKRAVAMLRAGKTRAEVARAVGLSRSRISAMFKGQTFRDPSEGYLDRAIERAAERLRK